MIDFMASIMEAFCDFCLLFYHHPVVCWVLFFLNISIGYLACIAWREVHHGAA